MYREQGDDTVSGAHRPRIHTMFSFTAGNDSSTLLSIFPALLLRQSAEYCISITLDSTHGNLLPTVGMA
jgi:hypothetical protein